MTGYRIDMSQLQQADADGDPLSGAKLYIYQNTTTTPLTVYSDSAGSVTAANPIVADASGRFAVRYVGATDAFTWKLTTSADVLVFSNDNIEPVPNIANASLANYLPLAGGTMTGALRLAEGSAVASATSIDLDASGGNFNHISGTTTINTMTLAQGAFRWLIFDGILTLTHSASLILPGSANIVTVAGDMMLVIGEGSGVTRCLDYRLVSGKALIENADFEISVGDESTALTTGTAKITFRMPYAMTLDALPLASLTTASSGAAPAIDINESGASIFSTTLTIDASELTSATAATPAVLSDTSLAFNASMTVDIDTAGTNAAGLKIILRGYRHNRT